MSPRLAWIGCAMLLWANQVLAQATTVQLPTFSQFSVATTVSVPDRGSALLGGVSRAYQGRNDFGVPCLAGLPYIGRGLHSSAIGGQAATGTMRLNVQVHDFEAMDRMALGDYASGIGRAAGAGAAPIGGPLAAIMGTNASNSKANNLARRSGAPVPVAASSAARPAESVSDARAQREAELAAVAAEAQQLFQRAVQAEAQGHRGAAKVYYQMAARRASGPLLAEIAGRLAALSAHESSAVAHSAGSARR